MIEAVSQLAFARSVSNAANLKLIMAGLNLTYSRAPQIRRGNVMNKIQPQIVSKWFSKNFR